jgi:chromosome partitioning protein
MATQVIAVAASKGGVGKTTLLSCLAVQAVKEDNTVAMLDWEPQGSLTLWWVARGKPTNPMLVRNAGDPVEEVEGFKADGTYRWVFLDTAPAGLDQIERAIEAADFVLVPVQASAFDLSAIRPVVAICQEQSKPFAFAISRENTHRKALTASAITHLKKLGGNNSVLTQHVQDRNAYVSAMTVQGRTGPEHPDSKQAKEARNEIEGLWDAIKRRIAKEAR